MTIAELIHPYTRTCPPADATVWLAKADLEVLKQCSQDLGVPLHRVVHALVAAIQEQCDET